MRGRLNTLLFGLAAAFLSALLLSACTNDLKKIQEISAKQVNSPADTTRNVDAIFSDSAKVKARMLAPLMLEYQISKEIKEPFKKMPTGVKVIFLMRSIRRTAILWPTPLIITRILKLST
jgi:outer membrane murein-binding lipoprotein Lpp